VSTWPPPPEDRAGDPPPAPAWPAPMAPPPPPPGWGPPPAPGPWPVVPAYGRPDGAPFPGAGPSTTNPVCVASLVLGICALAGTIGCLFLGVPLSIAAVATGIIGLTQQREDPVKQGKPMAVAGPAAPLHLHLHLAQLHLTPRR